MVVQKYFRGTVGTPERERSVRQLISRVADTITAWGRHGRDGKSASYFADEESAAIFNAELKHLLVTQRMAFNSPVWFNVGSEAEPQCSACFINSVDDTMESILGLAKTEGMLFKYGSGTGTNLSPIRSSKELLQGGGTASGPVSFMRGFDAFAGVIKSGGKTRRAAKMVMLDIDHPDVDEFIWCKAKEEKKAWTLIDAGYDGSFDGEAYKSVFFQNSNNSVRVSDDFMEAVQKDRDWTTRAVRDGSPVETVKARKLWRDIAEAAWQCGDPGLQYDTTINDWHTSAGTGRINASNPCSEYMYLDDSACNLASLNLRKFVTAGPGATVEAPGADEFDVVSFRRAVETTILAQEIIVGNAKYPTPKIAENSLRFRPLGPRLRQPGRAAHVARAAVRQRRGARLRGRHHRAHDRLGLPDQRRHRPRRDRSLRRLRREPRAVHRRHEEAPQGGRQDRHHGGAGRHAGGRARRLGSDAWPSARSTATATARPRCWRRRGPSAS